MTPAFYFIYFWRESFVIFCEDFSLIQYSAIDSSYLYVHTRTTQEGNLKEVIPKRSCHVSIYAILVRGVE